MAIRVVLFSRIFASQTGRLNLTSSVFDEPFLAILNQRLETAAAK
jgi:hypothetical protein